VGYTNAGTMEFLIDPEGRFYFLEMNTRLQVEHTVTEMVYGVDLVREQLRIAGGAQLGFTQESIGRRGHAIEARLCAEDPEQGFFPSAGVIEHLNLPGGPGVRLDVGVYEGQEITLHYDSMIGKLVCWGEDRGQALARLQEALRECVIAGIGTNVPFLRRLLQDDAIVEGRYDTGYIDAHLARLTGKGSGRHRFAAAVAAVLVHRERAHRLASNGSSHAARAIHDNGNGVGATDARITPWTLLGRPGGPR
jgi:3-methylcrotonyl-CoA carboxylase alpha subunit